MPETQQMPDDPPIAHTAVAEDEETTDALFRAARRAHVGLDESNGPLHDQVDADALDALTAHHRSRDDSGDFVLVVDLWGRTFVVTHESVRVFP
ncbi:MAG: hypothetical protein ABEJ26_08780 [Halosimplex sp.]